MRTVDQVLDSILDKVKQSLDKYTKAENVVANIISNVTINASANQDSAAVQVGTLRAKAIELIANKGTSGVLKVTAKASVDGQNVGPVIGTDGNTTVITTWTIPAGSGATRVVVPVPSSIDAESIIINVENTGSGNASGVTVNLWGRIGY